MSKGHSPNSSLAIEPLTEELSTPKRQVTGVLWTLLVISIVSSVFLMSLDNTVMANIRPGIVASLGHIEFLPWISVAYPMGQVSTILLWGTLYKQLNNKWLYCSTMTIFEIGSAVIGSAQNMSSFTVGRVIAGVGGSGIYIGTVNIISAMTVPAERARYVSYIGIAWCLGTLLGPIIGGAFNDSSATWRWAFYINICLAGAAAPAYLFLVPSFSPDSPHTVPQRLRRIDYVGSILFAGAVSCTIMVLSFGGAMWTWDSGRMIALYATGGVLWLVFVIQQTRSWLTVQRIFPGEFVADYEMCIFFVHSAVAIANTIVTIWTLPLFFQFIYGDSALRSGCFLLAVASTAVVVAGAGGALLPRLPLYMPWFVVACAFMILGSALLTTITSSTTRGVVCGYAVLQLFGCGITTQLPVTVAQIKSPRTAARSVTTFLICAQYAGTSLSIGIATSIFVNKSTSGIAAILPDLPRAEVQASMLGAGASVFQMLPEDRKADVLRVIGQTIAQVFYLNVASGALGLITALAMKRERLNFTK
ncbi:efflux pump antibiotic resistance protein [Lophiotrema nucula]|uniref:Efflux pump antibiotic resistance protein n=1 Tax=Lophiotrema nucula TaxID=690887 RepID=A0A6A5YZJ5_9PLEO|nr:efflux pump antibiotic resistance protein [Lophiotrema nucula]